MTTDQLVLQISKIVFPPQPLPDHLKPVAVEAIKDLFHEFLGDKE